MEKANYPVTVLCRVLRVSRSGFYDWCRRAPAPGRVALIGRVRRIHQRKRRSYGSRRMAVALTREGIPTGRDKARRLMHEARIECRQRRRFRVTTDSAHEDPVAPNRLRRRFDVPRPNRVWVADITAIWAVNQWLYLAAVLDLFDRQIVGWALAGHMRGALVRSALQMAVGRRQPAPGLMHHSDQGCQYAGADYRQLLRQYGMVASMSRRGDCWDNAVMERFFGSLKSEWLDGQAYTTAAGVRRDVIDYIEIEYNSDRPHSTLGMRTPREMGAVA